MKRSADPIIEAFVHAILISLFVALAGGLLLGAFMSVCGCAAVQRPETCPIPGTYRLVAAVEENTCPAGVAEIFGIEEDFTIGEEDVCGSHSYDLFAPAGQCDLSISVTIVTYPDPEWPLDGTETVTLSNCQFPAVDCTIGYRLMYVANPSGGQDGN